MDKYLNNKEEQLFDLIDQKILTNWRQRSKSWFSLKFQKKIIDLEDLWLCLQHLLMMMLTLCLLRFYSAPNKQFRFGENQFPVPLRLTLPGWARNRREPVPALAVVPVVQQADCPGSSCSQLFLLSVIRCLISSSFFITSARQSLCSARPKLSCSRL